MKTIIGILCLVSAVAYAAPSKIVVCQTPGAANFEVVVSTSGDMSVPTVVQVPLSGDGEATLEVKAWKNEVGSGLKPGVSGRHTVEIVLSHINNGYEAVVMSLAQSVVFPYTATIAYYRSNEDESDLELAFMGVSCDLK